MFIYINLYITNAWLHSIFKRIKFWEWRTGIKEEEKGRREVDMAIKKQQEATHWWPVIPATQEEAESRRVAV
jgi:hypothetical protein